METSTDINTDIGMVYAAMFGLALALTALYLFTRTKILRSEKNKQLLVFKAAAEAEEKERTRIASNLHDEIVPLLSVLVQNYEINIRDYEENKFKIGNLTEDKLIAIRSINDIKSVAMDLMPATLTNLGLIAALNNYLKNNRAVSNITLKDNTSYQSGLPFSKAEEVAIYRLCLELLTNLRKHDKFEFLNLIISNDEKTLAIRFQHNGQGINNEQIKESEKSSSGLGLKSIQSRLITLNATINYMQSKPASEIILKIPTHQWKNE